MMNQQNPANTTPAVVENELDIRGLFRVLWRGKPWIIGIAVLFAALAIGISFLVKQQWSATAITDKASINALQGYYTQQQFLRNLDAQSAVKGDNNPSQASIADEAYHEFVTQLAAYDTRRDFWLQNVYYKQRQEGSAQADAVLLDELINNIQFIPRDDKKNLNDSIKLTAETAADANQLLRDYVAFASRVAVSHLNEEMQGVWAARSQSLDAQVKRQSAVAQAVYQREINAVTQGLSIADKAGITRSQTSTPAEQLPDSDLFLLGKPVLQARLEGLQTAGPAYDISYDQNRAMLNTLQAGPVVAEQFQTYRYLRTPEEPITRDSPRRAFLLIMWGAIGALVGAGVALARRTQG